MKRRLDSDDNDFLLFKDYTLKISNPNFKIKEVLDYIN